MRPGRAEDLAPLMELWREEVRLGRQDIVPDEARMRRMLSRFDWEAGRAWLTTEAGSPGRCCW